MNNTLRIILIVTLVTTLNTFASANEDGATKPPPKAGDANFDGSVDIEDFLILKSNYGTTQYADWSDGDFDYDGDVDIHDFLILKSNFGL